MSSRNRIPPLLEPYLRLPSENSQLLLTGVLDASPQWLVTRLLRSAYHGETSGVNNIATETAGGDDEKNDNVAVVLVSWMRDWEFWKGEARRGAGLDLARLGQQHKFAFVDGLTQLFPVTSAASTTTPPPSSSTTPSQSPQRNLPIRGPAPTRGAPISRAPLQQQQQQQPTPPQTPTPQSAKSTTATTTTLKDSSLQTAQAQITSAITALKSSNPTAATKIHLILDSPTLALSTSPTPSSSALSTLLLHLRSIVHSATLVLEADAPFLEAARPDSSALAVPTPLEIEHAAFVVQQAHVSDWVVGLRPLDTGRARDVSGVVRASRGGAWEEEGDDRGKELEALYFVQPDGGVRVFERGEASVG